MAPVMYRFRLHSEYTGALIGLLQLGLRAYGGIKLVLLAESYETFLGPYRGKKRLKNRFYTQLHRTSVFRKTSDYAGHAKW